MRDAMEGRNFPHHLQQQSRPQQQQQQQHHQHRPIFQHQQQMMMMMGSVPSTTTTMSPSPTSAAATGVVMDVVVEGDRTFPQWSVQETKEFISIRSELDRTFMETKRNKVLWEVIANKMRDRGYQRSAEQCKCKWKNLVTRYKGCESIEPEAMRQQQFPLYNELQAIFTSRTMQHMLWADQQAEGGTSTSAGHKRKTLLLSSDEDELDELDIVHHDNVIEDQLADKNVTTAKNINIGSTSSSTSIKKRKKPVIPKGGVGAGAGAGAGAGTGAGGATISLMIKEVLEEFMRRQEAIEAQWRARYEAKENERRTREEEWRRRIVALEVERASMERLWREKDDARRAREDARADKRDALITVLLNKLSSSSSS